MAYVIDRYNGTTIATVEDGTIDATLDIKLIGKNYAGYGEIQNENTLHMLENFSGETAPPRPISGQLWYDSLAKKVKFYNNSVFKTIGAEPSGTKPAGGTVGDIWWDTSNKQLYTHDGTDFSLVGPQAAEGLGTTQMKSRSVLDTIDVAHAIIEAIVDDETIYIIATEEFTLKTSVNPITGFSVIKAGLTLINTGSTGVTSSTHRYWGTAANAEKLGGQAATNFVTKSGDANFIGIVTFVDAGFTVGDSNDLAVYITGADAFIKNQIGDRITFQTTSSGLQTPLILLGNSILPGTTLTTNIGSSSLQYNNIYANYLYGTSTQSDALSVSGVYRTASVSLPDVGDPNTIACRDSSGNLRATEFQGTATAAYFADLAEKYLADQEYEVGTVVEIGGQAEVTACQIGGRAFGAVSVNPAFKMNDGLVGGTYIALKGRVPVKVSGPVEKGDRLMAASNGTAAPSYLILRGQPVSSRTFPDTFAIALETNLAEGIKLVECVIL